MVCDGDPFHICTAPFVKETVLSPLNSHGTFILKKCLLIVYVRVYIQAVSLVSVSVFIPVPHSFDYCSSVISFEVMHCKLSFVLFQDCFDCLGSLAFPYEFQSLFSLFLQKKKIVKISIGITLNL